MTRFSLGTNVSALQAQRQLSVVSGELSTSLERLSSGLRINKASDDAAGLAISAGLNVQSRVYVQGSRNISDGVSALNIADGALNSLSDIVTRQRELAEQSANGVYSTAQRQALQREADSLTNEFNRIVSTVSFNGQNLLDGSSQNLQIQFGFGDANGIGLSAVREFEHAQFSGSLNPVQSFSGNYSDVKFSDVNGDGKADRIAAVSTNYFLVAFSNGDGTFAAAASYGTPATSPAQIAVVDVNGDGIKDVLGNSNSALSVNFGNSDGTFRAATLYSNWGSGSGQSMATADFNGDGYVDVISTTTKETGSFTVLYNSGTGTFSNSIQTSNLDIVSPMDDVNYIATGDFNGDGRSDFIGGSGSTTLFLANANGSWGVRTLSMFSGVSPANVLTGDFNSDGKIDAAFTSGTSIKIGFGNGDGTFLAAVTAVSGITSAQPLQYVDFNGDGYKDLFLQRTAGGSGATAYAAWGNGDGTFQAFITLSAGPTATLNNFSLADVTGDGVLDIADNNKTTHTVEISVAQTNQVTTQLHFSLITAADSRESLTYLTNLGDLLTRQRGALGAAMSRLDAANRAVQANQLGVESAAGRITDVDVADESSNVVKKQILQQASAAVLGQINSQSGQVLDLLR